MAILFALRLAFNIYLELENKADVYILNDVKYLQEVNDVWISSSFYSCVNQVISNVLFSLNRKRDWRFLSSIQT